MGTIEIISGTNRPKSNTRRVAGHVQEIFRSLGHDANVLDLEQLPREIFEPSVYETKPDSFEPWLARIRATAGIVVVVPEYNGGPPGILKYFIDMLPFPESFDRLPVCFIGIGAGEWGGLRPVEQMQQVFGYRHAHILPYRVFLKSIHRAFDANDKLTDQVLHERLAKQAEQFVEFIAKVGK